MGNTGGVSRRHDFELRPGEHLDVDDEARTRAREFRDVLGRYCSGVTVVTTVLDEVPVGLTCQSFTSVSLDPPLVAFLPTRESRALAAIRRTERFCVNFLAADQADLSEAMASAGDDKFAGVSWTRSSTGSAVLDGAVGHVDCTLHAVHGAGDHVIVIGDVVDLGVGVDEDPLLYHRGRYRTTS